MRLLSLSPGISRRDFWQAAAANFLFFCNVSAFSLLPLYIADLGGSEARIGWIMGVYSLAAFVFLPFVGRWVEGFGIKRFLLLGGATGLFASASFAFLTELSPLFSFLRILQGLGYSAFYIANLTLIAEIAPARHRAETVGMFGISGLIAMGAAPAFGELVIDAYGYQAFFLFASLFSLGGLLVVGVLKPLEVLPPTDHGWGGITKERILLPLLIAFIFGVCFGTLYAFFPPFAKGIGGVKRVGGFFVAYASCAVGIRVLGRRWADAWGRWQVVMPALFLYALGILLLLWPGPLRAQLWVGGLAGVGHGILYPTLTALLVDQVESGRRGRVLGLFSSAIVLGASLGPMAMGVVAQRIGYPGMFGLTGLLPLLGVLLIGISLRRSYWKP
ncbi:MAG: MFS transporter [candidate division NC10 bacterium]|nr:MFS transporter [candidate division NC10 bacterium]MCZ6551576.1 MFS transporter [candidate division NC10 bacterium]